MAKTWTLLSALVASILILSNTLRLPGPAPAVHGVLGKPTWSAAIDVSPYGGYPYINAEGGSGHHVITFPSTNDAGDGVTCATPYHRPGTDCTRQTCFEYDIDYYGSDIKKLEDGSVRSPQACQQMCAQTARCAYWTYIPETSWCYLKCKDALQGKTCRPSAISGPRICPSPYQSCYEIDTAYNGCDEKIVDHHVQSPEQCHLRCLAFPRCQFWTWVPTQRYCYLKNEGASRGRTHAPGSVSGPRQCVILPRSPPTDCCGQGIVPVPNPPPTVCCGNGSVPAPKPPPALPSPSPAAPCPPPSAPYPRHPVPCPPPTVRCPSPVEPYPPSAFPCPPAPAPCPPPTVPRPPPAVPGKPPADPCPPPIHCSGPGCVNQSCRNSCYTYNFAHVGHDLEVITTACEPKECQHFCQKHSLCRGFSYFTREKKCLLKSSVGEPVPTPNVISGPKFCPTPQCAIKDVEYYGKPLNGNSAKSLEECYRLCQKNPSCFAVTFENPTSTCKLIQRAGQRPGMVSGPKRCRSPCKNVGDRYTSPGTEVQYIGQLGVPFCHDLALAYTSRPFTAKHLSSAEMCQRHCRSQSRCKYFTYFLYGKVCLMHEAEGYRVPNVTAVSGPAACPDFGCFFTDVEVYGKEVGRCITKDAAECRKFCQKNRLCSFFAYDVVSKICHQRQHRGPAPGWTSAPLYCGMPDDEIIVSEEQGPDMAPGAPGKPGPPSRRPPIVDIEVSGALRPPRGTEPIADREGPPPPRSPEGTPVDYYFS